MIAPPDRSGQARGNQWDKFAQREAASAPAIETFARVCKPLLTVRNEV